MVSDKIAVFSFTSVTVPPLILTLTQLNTNARKKQRKEAPKSLYKSLIFKKKQSILFLNNSNVPQLINHTGKLYYASITLIAKEYFLASKETQGLKSLSS